MTIQTVTLFGATGNLGRVLLPHLLSAGYTVLCPRRSTSTTTLLPAHTNLRTLALPPAFPLPSLLTALSGQDAVVVALPLSDLDLHLRIATAAARAGVRHYLPADFGSVDSDSARARELVPLFGRKRVVRERLRGLAGEVEGFEWTGLVVGHFFDWGLREGFLHVDVPGRRAVVVGDGAAVRSSLSTLGRVAEAVVGVLRLHGREEVRGRTLFVQSFCVTQDEVLEAVRRVRGGEWTVERVGLEEYIEERKGRADAGDKQAVEDLVFALGVVDGDWRAREDYAMDLLGLEDQDLQTVVNEVVKEIITSADA